MTFTYNALGVFYVNSSLCMLARPFLLIIYSLFRKCWPTPFKSLVHDDYVRPEKLRLRSNKELYSILGFYLSLILTLRIFFVLVILSDLQRVPIVLSFDFRSCLKVCSFYSIYMIQLLFHYIIVRSACINSLRYSCYPLIVRDQSDISFFLELLTYFRLSQVLSHLLSYLDGVLRCLYKLRLYLLMAPISRFAMFYFSFSLVLAIWLEQSSYILHMCLTGYSLCHVSLH